MFLNMQRFLGVSLAIISLVSAVNITPAEAARHHKKHVVHQQQDRFAEIVLESSSGYVLSERNPDKRLYPASLTKMMTLYLTFDALESGKLTKNTRIPVSRHAAAQEPSSLGLAPGETIRVEDAILSVATKSANDSAVVLAEAMGGTEDHFAAMMTAKAHQLGMNNTHFLNASGLFKQGHYSTVRDMSTLAQALIHNHPREYRYFSTESFTYNGVTMLNHNHLMSSYRGMDGLKTGYVYASGYNLAASAVRNGTRLVGVIFGGATAKSRNNAMAQLLNQSFARISSGRIALTAQRQPVPAPRPLATPDVTPEVTAENTAPQAPAASPQFNSMGLTVDQGDAALTTDDAAKENANTAVTVNATAAQKNLLIAMQPQPINTVPLTQEASAAAGNWAIQIGAFSSHDAGEQALQSAKSTLAGQGLGNGGINTIAPLMTPYGMVYRARLSGLARASATQACRVLKGNCLILSVD